MDRKCKKELEKFGMTVDDITHVCIAPNLYPLLQYLLLMDDDIVFHHTCYFVNEIIPENIQEQLPCIKFIYYGKKTTQEIHRRLSKLRLLFFKYLDYPFLKEAAVFAYDLPFLSLCIGKRPYSLLSDAPYWLTLNMQENSQVYIRMQNHANSLTGKLQRAVFGDLFVHYFGNNSQCEAVYLTEENVSPVLEGKTIFVNSLESHWANASEQKRQFIMKLFNITADDISLLQSRPNLFFSQPLLKDCGLTEAEYIDILDKIFKNYPKDSIIIKTHPRDDFDYERHYPDTVVFSKSVSSQFLQVMGISPKKLITISSTAIEGFPLSVECDYYGIHVHPKIERFFGEEYKPVRKVNSIEVNSIDEYYRN